MISKKSNEEVNFENNFFDFYYRNLKLFVLSKINSRRKK